MSAFDKIIGYDVIKKRLDEICDMVHHPELYRRLGAKPPRGLLLYGEPGIGKTMMAKALMEEMGYHPLILRRNPSSADFIAEISQVFKTAKETAPSVLLLDDMDRYPADKFSSEEYAAIQAGIDELKDSEVFLIATANEINDLPEALLRCGRFDRQYELHTPERGTAAQIIRHYLKDKPVIDDLNYDDIMCMMVHRSCAELETLLNEAAIYAAYARRTHINMDDFVQAVLRKEVQDYDSPEYDIETGENREKLRNDLLYNACHEAGHTLVMELLIPGGSGFAVATPGPLSIFRRSCGIDDWEHRIMVRLGGMASTELVFARKATGCSEDIAEAFGALRVAIRKNCLLGNQYAPLFTKDASSEHLLSAQEQAAHDAFERLLNRTKMLIAQNRDKLDRLSAALVEKRVLLHSDIAELMAG